MKRTFLALALTLLAGNAFAAQGKLNVVTTTSDLASITREVGGDFVDVTSIARGYQDPHFVEPKPSFLLLLKNADLLEIVGLDLEIGWLRRSSIRAATRTSGPARPATRRLARSGDPRSPGRRGEPLDGRRPPARQSALLARSRTPCASQSRSKELEQLQPRKCRVLSEALNDFAANERCEQRWTTLLAPFKGAKIVTYHNPGRTSCAATG
jgi:hypothetical protein